MTLEINAENLDEMTSREGILLVDCWAPWCRNCDEFAESYRQSAAKHPAHLFAKLNTDDQPDLRSKLGIQYVPSLLVYRDGVMLFNQPGSYDEAKLDDIVAQAESLDMNAVREELASQEDDSAG